MSTTPLLWKDDGTTMTWDHFHWDGVVVQNKNMKRVKDPTKGKKNPEVLPVTDSLITGATGKAELANSPVTLVELGDQREAAAEALTAENEARDAWLTARETTRGVFSTLRTSVNRFAMHANAVYMSDTVKLQALGLALFDSPTPTGVLPAPTNLRSRPGKLNECIDLLWNPVRGRESHELQIAESADGPWSEVYRGKKTRACAPDLIAGKLYFFRLRAHGAAGPGAWSDITSARAS
jgi:hypothetical protein